VIRCIFNSFLIVLILIFIVQCSPSTKAEKSSESPLPDGEGRKGMVSAAHPLATQAGLDILASGGNAFDAAVAVAAVLNVVEPMKSGIGGYGTILIFDAKKERVRYLDSSGRIPRAVNSDLFRPPVPDYMRNRLGAKSVSTPGNVNAWEAMSKEYGRLRWKELFKPAIRLAEEGFTLDDWGAGAIGYYYHSFPDHAKEFYGREGRALKKGECLIQKDLARSLKVISEQGAKAFYVGEIGKAIHDTMKKTGGFLSIDDLRADRAEWWDPIHIVYNGYKVYTASPPSTAFSSLIRLGLVSQFNTADLKHNSAAYLHRFAEASKHAYWCRLAYAGDPGINPPPLDKLLSKEYWREQAAKLNVNTSEPFIPPDVRIHQGANTTHFVVADKEGNIVSATQTLGNDFGSRIMPEGTGIWLNNSLFYCTFEPKGNPMDAHPGHRKLSGDCPTIIMSKDKPWVALGTPGGHTIGQTVPQIVINLIDFKMDIQRAIAAPRISFIEPNILAVEERIPVKVRETLEKMGHRVKVVRALGNAHGLSIEYGSDGRPSKFIGSADPRGRGQAKGL
jgi:gamma-glutamyltranspeptidase/glutathione hydrolase